MRRAGSTLWIVAMLALPAWRTASAAEGAMTLAWLRGEATAVRGVERAALAEGAILHGGDLVETGPAARLEIALPTGSLLRLGPGSRLLLSGEEEGSFRAKLSLGNLWAKVVKLTTGRRFEIETQNGVAGVRGTEFHVAATRSGQATVRVYEGKVEVKGAAFTHLVEPGRELRFSSRAVLGPRPFDPKVERNFMRWVRRRDEASRSKPERGDREPRRRQRAHEREQLRRELRQQ